MKYSINNLYLLDSMSLMDLQTIAILLKIPTRCDCCKSIKLKSNLRADIKTKIIFNSLNEQ